MYFHETDVHELKDAMKKGQVQTHSYLSTLNFLFIFTSVQSQLEFLTLTGIIFGALMQGYICANSIYVYLIENIETEPLDFSHSAYKIDDDYGDEVKKDGLAEKTTQA